MEKESLSEKVTKQQVNQEDKSVELNFTVGCQVGATEEEDGMGESS
jgi:hypothetical protein